MLLLQYSIFFELDDLSYIIAYVHMVCVCPSENSRSLQVLHYELEDAEKKYNYFGNKSTLEQSEPLVATVVLYLSNVTRGGEILFPQSEVRQNHRNKLKALLICVRVH